MAFHDEDRFIPAFAGFVVAYAVIFGGVACGIAAGYFVGKTVWVKYDQMLDKICQVIARRRHALVLGWVVGVVTAIVVFTTIYMVGRSIPGVGSRIEKIHEMHDDE